MNQEILLEPSGDAIHLVFRHYRDPLAASMLGHRLGLHEVPPPGAVCRGENGNATTGRPASEEPAEGANGHGVPGLHRGEYYQVGLAGGDSELHALVPQCEIGQVGEAIRTWHVPVIEGADLLPPSEAAPVASDDVAAAPESEAIVPSYRARAILSGLALLAFTSGLVFVGWRTHSQEQITMANAVARATAPPAAGVRAAIWRWAMARDVRIPLRQVLFLGPSKLVLGDGTFVAVEGAGDLRNLLALATAEKAEPVIETAAWPPSPTGEFAPLPIDRIRCGKVIFSRGGTLRPLAVLTPALHQPPRTRERQADSFWLVSDLRFDDGRRLRSLVGQRISVRGRITSEGPDRLLRLENGTGILFQPLPAESRVAPFLAGLVNDATQVQVDFVFERMLPWRNAQHPDASRQETKIAGVGRVCSVSVESLVLTDLD